MFKKLNFSIKDIIGDPFSYRGEVETNFNDTFIEYKARNGNLFMQKVQEFVTFDIMPDFINFTEIRFNGSGPHTDKQKTALNFYFDTEDDVTMFFDELQPIDQKPAHRNFNKESVIEIARFIANPYDVYLLNTHKIHTVKISNKEANRAMVRFMWNNVTFNDVLRGIKPKTPR